MNSKLFNVMLTVIDSFLLFTVVCVLPFAWILRDGLGPESIRSTGLSALSRAFMTFYVGPAILLLVCLDLLVRSRTDPENSLISRKVFILPAIIIFIFIALGAVSFRLLSGH